jgi:hypothetical protein
MDLRAYLPPRKGQHRDFMVINGRHVPGWRWQWVRLFRKLIGRG